MDLLRRDNLPRVESKSAPATWKSMLALVFCFSFLTIQIVVPILKLTSQRPARFGWHMWAARKKFPRFFVVLKDGTTKAADLSLHIGLSRGEMDFTEELPPHLCRVVPDITAVEIKTPHSELLKVHTCR